MMKKGIAEIYDLEGKKIVLNGNNELEYETGERVNYSDFGDGTGIDMLAIEIIPNLEEMKVCTPFLQRQLALIKPKIIGCLGNVACHYVIGPTMPGITRLRGQWFDSIFGIPTFAMYHPSYLIRSESREKGSPNWQMWQDIRALKAKYDEI